MKKVTIIIFVLCLSLVTFSEELLKKYNDLIELDNYIFKNNFSDNNFDLEQIILKREIMLKEFNELMNEKETRLKVYELFSIFGLPELLHEEFSSHIFLKKIKIINHNNYIVRKKGPWDLNRFYEEGYSDYFRYDADKNWSDWVKDEIEYVVENAVIDAYKEGYIEGKYAALNNIRTFKNYRDDYEDDLISYEEMKKAYNKGYRDAAKAHSEKFYEELRDPNSDVSVAIDSALEEAEMDIRDAFREGFKNGYRDWSKN
ncbi:MAG: hypothetical protein WC002_03310 [Candidatus Muiribacteriota bacterium]